MATSTVAMTCSTSGFNGLSSSSSSFQVLNKLILADNLEFRVSWSGID